MSTCRKIALGMAGLAGLAAWALRGLGRVGEQYYDCSTPQRMGRAPRI